MSRITPKQGQRERVYVLLTFQRDDNGDQVEGSDRILAGTSSEKVARLVLETFKQHRNGHVTMVHEANQERYLPGLLGQILEGEEEDPEVQDHANVDALLELVDLGDKK